MIVDFPRERLDAIPWKERILISGKETVSLSRKYYSLF